MPGPLRAPRWIFSSWNLTEFKGTVHPLISMLILAHFKALFPDVLFTSQGGLSSSSQ